MADVYLHSRLAEEVTKELEFDFHIPLLFMGAQGPDPMYYNAFSKDRREYRYYADRMHDTDTRKLFLSMINAVKENNTQNTYSFLIGFVCHYALDVNIHPYVYHNVGVFKKQDPSTHSYRGLHLKFERSIDAVIIEEEQHIKANKLKLIKTYFLSKMVPLDVIGIMNTVLKEAYNKDHGGVMYLISVNKMYHNIKHFITDRYGIKKQIMKFFDLFNKRDLFYKDLSFYNHIENYDYTNKKKNTWYHPITNQPSNKDVYEIFEDAKTFALSLIKVVDQYLDGKDIKLEEYFTNLSFNSGIDCEDEREMQYFNIYRK
jgi:hypothetical protein